MAGLNSSKGQFLHTKNPTLVHLTSPLSEFALEFCNGADGEVEKPE